MKCSVKDYKGNNCSENANHTFIRNNELVSLCDKCFVNYRNGAYGDFKRPEEVSGTTFEKEI